MVQNATDVVPADVGQPAVAGLVVEQRSTVQPQRLVGVHSGPVVAEQWLGHERHGPPGRPCGVLHDVLVELVVVGRVQQGVVPVVDLRLTRGAYLVVRFLYREAAPDQVRHHRVTQIGEMVGRRHREVPALVPRLVAAVPALLDRAGVPLTLDRVDEVEPGVLLGLEAHAVENVELGLGADVHRVGDSRRLEVLLGLLRHLTRVAAVRLAGTRLDDREVDVQCLRGTERVDVGRRRVRDQLHIRLVDRGETADRRAVEHDAVVEELLGQIGRRHVEVLLLPGEVREPDVDELDVLFLDVTQDLVGASEHPSSGEQCWNRERMRAGLLAGVSNVSTVFRARLQPGIPVRL